MEMKKNEIMRCTPEEVGIPSGAVVEFCENIRQKGVTMHSFILARFGRVFAEGYYAPWNASENHRMFSETKSFVSLAIGCLVQEKKVCLDDAIVSYFPEYTPENSHPYLAEMTIRQMLKMQSCHKTTTYKADMTKNWVESFFTTKPDHRPGTIFNYDTSSTHVLCALVEKLSGKKLLDYLRERCLDEIGFSQDAYVIADPFGTSMGGSGLMAKPEDMLRVGLLLMNRGNWNGKQLIPAAYIEEASAFQVPTAAKGPIPEESEGYGYQFWRMSRDGFAMYGMGGQFVMCLPKYQLVCVTTANTMRRVGGNQVIYDSLYETITAAIEGRENYLEYTENELASYLTHLKLEPVRGERQPQAGLLSAIQNVTYRIENPNSLIQRVRFSFLEEADEGTFYFEGEKGSHALSFGVRKPVVSSFPLYEEPCFCTAAWIAGNSLYLTADLMGENIGDFWMQVTWKEDTITIFMNRTIEFCTGELSGFLSGKQE